MDGGRRRHRCLRVVTNNIHVHVHAGASSGEPGSGNITRMDWLDLFDSSDAASNFGACICALILNI